jgi:hypothetical protein
MLENWLLGLAEGCAHVVDVEKKGQEMEKERKRPPFWAWRWKQDPQLVQQLA